MSDTPPSLWKQIADAWTAFGNWWAGDPAKQPVLTQLRRFFGESFDKIETHEKHYPGYDIVSLHRALSSFHGDCCISSRVVGGINAMTVRAFFDLCRDYPHYRLQKAMAPTCQRVPVDVDEEISVANNVLSVGLMKPEAGTHRYPAKSDRPREPERFAFLLATNVAANEYWDGMDTNRVPQQQVTISIACRSKDVADRFFAEVEDRRKRMSIYRGKVIDPVLNNGVIFTIAFRPIKRVRAEDLVLPDGIKKLLQNSIVGFYSHRELLEGLGIDMKHGILLHGPPGTGKTSISLYLAGLLPQFTVCIVSGERLLYPREICRMARYLQPAMVVFEDIDLIAQARDTNGLATVLGELMNQIDGCEPAEQVLFLMNTNSLERLESAVRNRPGRVDQIIEVPLPDGEARRHLLAYFARNLKIGFEDLDNVLQATDGMTPAMLKEIVKRAAVSAIERNGSNGSAVTILESDVLLAAQQVQSMRDPIAVPGRLGFRESRV